MEAKKSSNLKAVDFGIATVSFGSLLAIYTVAPRSVTAVHAADILATCIPILIAAILFERVLREYRKSAMLEIVTGMVRIAQPIASIGCFNGIRVMLKDIGPEVASHFFYISAVCYGSVFVISGAFELHESYAKK